MARVSTLQRLTEQRRWVCMMHLFRSVSSRVAFRGQSSSVNLLLVIKIGSNMCLCTLFVRMVRVFRREEQRCQCTYIDPFEPFRHPITTLFDHCILQLRLLLNAVLSKQLIRGLLLCRKSPRNILTSSILSLAHLLQVNLVRTICNPQGPNTRPHIG
jgi:hypothetical protein